MADVLNLVFVGNDSWDRPVYECDGVLYCDVEPRAHRQPEICTKYNNEFDGEPDTPVRREFVFIPKRITW